MWKLIWELVSGFFADPKMVVGAVGVAVVGGYVVKNSLDTARAEKKLKNVESDISKYNLVVAKATAKAKATNREIESTTEIEILKGLKVERKKVLKELDDMTLAMEENSKNKKAVTGRKRGKTIHVKI